MVRGKKRAKATSSGRNTRRSTRLQSKHASEHDESPEIPGLLGREESPPWVGMDSGHLPDDEDLEHKSTSPVLPDDGEEQGPNPQLSDAEPEVASQPASAQAAKARSPRWQSWQDRYLAQAVDKIRPFLLPASEREEGWNRTAQVLLEDSRRVGSRSTVDRTGSACKNRFTKLMKEHKVCTYPHFGSCLTSSQKGETESRMKTGAVEEVSEHLKVS